MAYVGESTQEDVKAKASQDVADRQADLEKVEADITAFYAEHPDLDRLRGLLEQRDTATSELQSARDRQRAIDQAEFNPRSSSGGCA